MHGNVQGLNTTCFDLPDLARGILVGHGDRWAAPMIAARSLGIDANGAGHVLRTQQPRGCDAWRKSLLPSHCRSRGECGAVGMLSASFARRSKACYRRGNAHLRGIRWFIGEYLDLLCLLLRKSAMQAAALGHWPRPCCNRQWMMMLMQAAPILVPETLPRPRND